jgi:hypothetical protein
MSGINQPTVPAVVVSFCLAGATGLACLQTAHAQKDIVPYGRNQSRQLLAPWWFSFSFEW